MSTTVRVSEEAKKKLVGIKKSNPQFNTDAEVFDHILNFYLGKTILPLQKHLAPTRNNEYKPGSASSPIINADKFQIVGWKS